MSAGLRTSRRRFLLGALGVGLPLLLAPLRPWRMLVEVVGPASPGARLAGLLQHRESARIIGLEYLRSAAEEATVPTLVGSIASALPGGRGALDTAGEDELRELVTVLIRRDFEEERTVTLQGWIVSRTEAQLCALAALV